MLDKTHIKMVTANTYYFKGHCVYTNSRIICFKHSFHCYNISDAPQSHIHPHHIPDVSLSTFGNILFLNNKMLRVLLKNKYL